MGTPYVHTIILGRMTASAPRIPYPAPEAPSDAGYMNAAAALAITPAVKKITRNFFEPTNLSSINPNKTSANMLKMRCDAEPCRKIEVRRVHGRSARSDE